MLCNKSIDKMLIKGIHGKSQVASFENAYFRLTRMRAD